MHAYMCVYVCMYTQSYAPIYVKVFVRACSFSFNKSPSLVHLENDPSLRQCPHKRASC